MTKTRTRCPHCSAPKLTGFPRPACFNCTRFTTTNRIPLELHRFTIAKAHNPARNRVAV